MRTRMMALALVLMALVACNDRNIELVGTWKSKGKQTRLKYSNFSTMALSETLEHEVMVSKAHGSYVKRCCVERLTMAMMWSWTAAIPSLRGGNV